MSESRIAAAAFAALGIITGSSAASAGTTISVPLSQFLTDGGSYSGSFDLSALLTQGGTHYEVTGGTIELQATSPYDITGYTVTGYRTISYTIDVPYRYACGLVICSGYYQAVHYEVVPIYYPVDNVLDTLSLSSGTDTSTGSDSWQRSPLGYSGSLAAQLSLGAGSIASANSTGLVSYSGTAVTNTYVKLTNATLTLALQQVLSEAPAGAVPEPSTWAMMLLGFGAIGVAMRRRRHSGLALAG